MRYLILLFSLFLILSCADTPVDAPIDYNSSLEGVVSFEDGLANSLVADITLFREGETNVIGETQTDTIGFYYFDHLTPGIYQINISASGYETYTMLDTLLSDQTTAAETIQMSKILLIEFKDISVDGEIDENWESNYENTHASSWGDYNNFENLYIAMDESNLYIAVQGEFDSGGNAVNIYIDKDYGGGTGLNEFSNISGGSLGDHLRKNISATSDFGADIAFTAWALNYDIGVVSLGDGLAVDQNIIEDANISLNSNVIEFSVPFSSLYENGDVPHGEKIALVAVIGGGEDSSFSDNSMPQIEGGFTGNFTIVYSIAY